MAKYGSNAKVAGIAMQVAKLESKQKKARRKTKYVFLIDPRTSPWIGYWDLILSFALVFTAAFTPVEVAFMGIPEDRWRDPLFVVNRIVDLIFILDMGMQFILMHPAKEGQIGGIGSSWVTDPRAIAKNYLLSSWFVLDFFSISVSALDIFSPEDSGVSRLKVLRALRVLRMLKLVRLVRGSRIFHRWENRLSINYAVLSIANICIMLLFVCHLFACVWGLQASFDPLGSWLGAKEYCVPYSPSIDGPCPAGQHCSDEEGWVCAGPWAQYLYSLYWSIATVTSIGYGDVVATPLHGGEQV